MGADREADFGFVNPDAIPGVKTKFIKSGELRAVLPVTHPLAQKSYIALENLAKEPFLLLEEGALSEPMEAFKQAGLEPVIRLCVHDDYSILSMIESELGVEYFTGVGFEKNGIMGSLFSKSNLHSLGKSE